MSKGNLESYVKGLAPRELVLFLSEAGLTEAQKLAIKLWVDADLRSTETPRRAHIKTDEEEKPHRLD